MAINLGSSSIEEAKLGSTQVDKIYLGNEDVWSKVAPVSIKAIKFTSAETQFIAIERAKLGSIRPTLEYSTDNGSTWTTWNIANAIEFGNGTDLYVRGTNTLLAAPGDNYLHFVFYNNVLVDCTGNIMWLYDYTQDLTVFNADASNRGVKYMFSNCTVLRTPPDLPATTFAASCYSSMFKNCTKVKMSQTQVGEYQNEYRFGANPNSYSYDMFASTGGTYTTDSVHVTTDLLYTANRIIS